MYELTEGLCIPEMQHLLRSPFLSSGILKAAPNASGLWSSRRRHSFHVCAYRTSLHPLSSPPRFSPPSIFDFVDLSEFFLTGCDHRCAPKCPNYIGPVRIDRTPDGRGRGLFVTQNVEPGDVLIINNAFAASYNDINSARMYELIAATVKKSPRALRQFYSLAADVHQETLVVPGIELFDDSTPYMDDGDLLEFSEARVRHIIQVNSFSGKLTTPENQEQGKINGLWLLPSFMNHSCCPTASRLLVGETMLFMAVQKMKEGDEITICYTDCMAPLIKRDKVLGITCCGFKCGCKRCEFERSVHGELQDIGDRYESLYDEAAKEVTAVATTRYKGPYLACKELEKLYDSLRRRVAKMDRLAKLQKQWILGGYSCAFLGNWLTLGYMSDFGLPCEHLNLMAMELVEAMKATVPGMQRTLSFSVLLATATKSQDHRLTLVEHAMDECVKMYGKQRPDVLRKLAQNSVQFVPFL